MQTFCMLPDSSIGSCRHASLLGRAILAANTPSPKTSHATLLHVAAAAAMLFVLKRHSGYEWCILLVATGVTVPMIAVVQALYTHARLRH